MSGKALADAVHIAMATTHKIKVVASFNFNYAAGVAVRARLENSYRQLSYGLPRIAPPEEILRADDDYAPAASPR